MYIYIYIYIYIFVGIFVSEMCCYVHGSLHGCVEPGLSDLYAATTTRKGSNRMI